MARERMNSLLHFYHFWVLYKLSDLSYRLLFLLVFSYQRSLSFLQLTLLIFFPSSLNSRKYKPVSLVASFITSSLNSTFHLIGPSLSPSFYSLLFSHWSYWICGHSLSIQVFFSSDDLLFSSTVYNHPSSSNLFIPSFIHSSIQSNSSSLYQDSFHHCSSFQRYSLSLLSDVRQNEIEGE